MDSDWSTGEAEEDNDDNAWLEYAAIERFHQNVAAAMFPRIVNVRVTDAEA